MNDLEGLPTTIETQHCPTCESAVPLENLRDRVSRNKQRRIVTQSCSSCDRTYIARFRREAGRWLLIGKVKVIIRRARAAAA